MNVLLAPVGTRGDVQAFVALGLELRQRGHAVTVAAPANFASFVQSFSLDFVPACGDYMRFTDCLRDRPFLEVLRGQIAEQFEHLMAASAKAEVLVGSMLQVAGPSVAELRGIPYAFMLPAPVFFASDEHPPVTEFRQDLGPEANRSAWLERARAWEMELAPELNTHRRELGLEPICGVQEHVLHSGRLLLGCEPVLAGRPHFRAPDVRTTGAWFLDEGTLPPEAGAFCRAGEPPLLIGFGSMRFRPADELSEMFVAAARRANVRLIMATGWSELVPRSWPENCLSIREAPYHLLLPLVRGAIHHGGAGTVHAAARAGIPQGLVPHFADQPYWASRVHQLGLGPAGIPINELTVSGLARMMRQLVSVPSFALRAEELGRQIRPAKGVQRAAALIERLGSHSARRSEARHPHRGRFC